MLPRFWRKIRYRYELRGSECGNCGNIYYPPRNLCPVCRRKGKMREVALPEKGKVISYTVVWEGENSPYVLALIELENGTRLLSQIACEPNEVSVGCEVVRAFRKYGEEGEEGIIYYGTKFVPGSEK